MSDPHSTHPGSPDPADGPTPPASTALLGLRVTALVGTAAVVLANAASLGRLQPRQEYAFVVLVLAVLGVGLTLRLLLWPATRRLIRHPDLLVPLGLYLAADALLGLLATVPLFAPGRPVTVLSISVTLSVVLVIQILLAIVYIGWTTVLVLQAVRSERVDPVGALAEFGRWFPRVAVVGVIGWGVLFVGLAVALAVGKESVGLAMFLMGVGALVWNLATAALLPVAVAERGRLGPDLRAGFRVSWAGKRRWWPALVAQMVLLGWVTYIHVSFTSNPRPGAVRTQTKTSWNVNGFWTGGYEDTCRWHANLMKVVEADPVHVVTALLVLVFSVLAVAIKLRIAGDIYGPGPAEPEGAREGDGDRAEIAT